MKKHFLFLQHFIAHFACCLWDLLLSHKYRILPGGGKR